MADASAEKTVNFREFRSNLSVYLRAVRQGAEIVVTSHGKPVARVVPPVPSSLPEAELVGMFRGQLHMAADFDETPADLIAAMESGV